MVERVRPTDEPDDPEERQQFWEHMVTGNISLCGACRTEEEEDFRRMDEPGVRDTPDFWEWLIDLREKMWCRLLGGCDDAIDDEDFDEY